MSGLVLDGSRFSQLLVRALSMVRPNGCRDLRQVPSALEAVPREPGL